MPCTKPILGQRRHSKLKSMQASLRCRSRSHPVGKEDTQARLDHAAVLEANPSASLTLEAFNQAIHYAAVLEAKPSTTEALEAKRQGRATEAAGAAARGGLTSGVNAKDGHTGHIQPRRRGTAGVSFLT